MGVLMKDQINKFARGVFEYEPPVLEVSETSVYAVVEKNREYEGYLHIYERTGKDLKGIVYSDNDKVIIYDSSFSGSKGTIPYSVKCKGALNGDIIEGSFRIISNGGEEHVPFSFRVEAGSHDSTAGVIRNLFHFTNLAQTDAEEAVTLFAAEDFEEVYIGDDLQLRSFYEGMQKGRDPRNNIEEFLIAVHKKTKVNLVLSHSSKEYSQVTESFKDSVTLEKDTWGYLNVMVQCQDSFIRLEKKFIDSDSFTGNRYEFAYVIDYERLHGGLNLGRIIFETQTQSVSFLITVTRPYDREKLIPGRTIKRLTVDLVDLYIRFRSHSVNMTEWIRESKLILEAIRSCSDSCYFRLALAQVYLAEKKLSEAKELLESVKDEIEMENPEDQVLYAYLIYVNTLYNRDRAYSKKAALVVREAYEKNRNWRILWILLFLDEDLEMNQSLKLLRIKEQYNSGCRSPILYLEACSILNEQPLLLRLLNSFELSVLLFGAENDILDKKLRLHVSDLMADQKFPTKRQLLLLKQMYDSFGDTQILECLCKMLIRNNGTGPDCLPYYEAGILSELKITQLFEYYIMSRHMDDMRPLPKMVLMYFSYNNSLSVQYKAYLYANIIHNKGEIPQVYRSYLPQMELFVMEQMSKGMINDNIAVVYRSVMRSQMITRENAEAVSDLFFTYKIYCKNPSFQKVLIRHKEGDQEEEYILTHQTGYVKIYTEEASVYFVNQYGNRFSESVSYELEKVLDNQEALATCLAKNEDLIHLKIHNCEKAIKYQRKTLEAIDGIRELIDNPQINEFCKRKLIGLIVDYYYNSYDGEGFESFVDSIDVGELSEQNQTKIIEIFIMMGKYQSAFDLATEYSMMQVQPKRLLKMCSKLIGTEGFRPSEGMIRMCGHVFFKGKYDETVLDFLIGHYNGTTKEMVEVWKKAMEEGFDTYDLEERLIAQMLFTHSYSGIIAEVFDHYYSKGAHDRIVEAYLAYNSYLFFVKGKIVAEEIFSIMEVSMENGKELALICKMALMRFYSELDNLNEFRKGLAEQMIFELTRKGYLFEFYSKFNGLIRIPFDIVDKTMVEYRTNPNHRVVIHYIFEDKNNKRNYVAEDMKNVYEGIFVKDFVLFYGETLQYYIVEETNDSSTITESCTITNHKVSPSKSEGRYEAINDIIASHEMHDGETYRKLIHKYAVHEFVTKEIFRPL